MCGFTTGAEDATVGDIVMLKAAVTIDINMNGRIDASEPGLADTMVKP